MDYKDAYIKQLELTIENLQHQVDNLTEIINLLKKEKFGSSSEKTPKEEFFGQLGFFDEAESCGTEDAPEPIKTTARGFVRVNPKTKRQELFKDLSIREILCESGHEDLLCNQCHAGLRAGYLWCKLIL